MSFRSWSERDFYSLSCVCNLDNGVLFRTMQDGGLIDDGWIGKGCRHERNSKTEQLLLVLRP